MRAVDPRDVIFWVMAAVTVTTLVLVVAGRHP